MSYHDTVVHLVAGGLGGTAGAIATCPLEVVKTRLQSSVASFECAQLNSNSSRLQLCYNNPANPTAPENNPFANPSYKADGTKRNSSGIWRCIKHIVETEGARALFKGLGPNLVGVAPSRALYFCTYSNIKNFCNGVIKPDTPLVHICSAASAGFTSCTLTNPIWFVKTRLQLDQRKYGSVTAFQCVREIYSAKGILGFYKGITASYFGISETIIHFVIYEFIKAELKKYHEKQFYTTEYKSPKDFAAIMFAGAISKTCASIIAYPHEVARTRLRQEGNKYHSFFQTLFLVYREEGQAGLYRGLATQLVRQIPNTAIMMAVYEASVYLLSSYQCGVPALQLCNEDDKEPC